jgi:hypothetical protein
MAKRQPRQGIPTNLSVAQFEQFVLPHLSKGSRGPAKKLSFHAIFNYILRLLYLVGPAKFSLLDARRRWGILSEREG